MTKFSTLFKTVLLTASCLQLLGCSQFQATGQETGLTGSLSAHSYNASSNGSGVAVMALGDSMTEGYAPDEGDDQLWNGYRAMLYDNVVFDFHYVGSHQLGAPDLADQWNEGHSGFTIGQISAGIHTWLTSTPADVILLQIGTNDILQGKFDGVQGRLDTLITRIFKNAPNALLIIAKIPPINSDPTLNAQVDQYNQMIDAEVNQFQTNGANVLESDNNTGFSRDSETDIGSDGVHPTNYGYERIGLRWANALNNAAMNGFVTMTPRPDFQPAAQDQANLDRNGDAFVDGGTYLIANAGSDLCLAVAGGQTGDGARIQQVNCDQSRRPQLFKVHYNNDDEGTISLLSVVSGKAIDVALDTLPANGTIVDQYDFAGTPNQMFSLTQGQYGFTMQPAAAWGTCLDINSQNINTPGEKVLEMGCTMKANQSFVFIPVN